MATETATRPVREERPATWRGYDGHTWVGVEYRYVEADGRVGQWRTEGFSASHSDTCSCWTSEEGFMGFEEFAGEVY